METKEKNWEDVFANRSQDTEQDPQKFRQNYLHQVYIQDTEQGPQKFRQNYLHQVYIYIHTYTEDGWPQKTKTNNNSNNNKKQIRNRY